MRGNGSVCERGQGGGGCEAESVCFEEGIHTFFDTHTHAYASTTTFPPDLEANLFEVIINRSLLYI